MKADGTMLGFKVRAIDDCGAFPRYEPLGCIIWAQVTPGCYRWRNIRVDFTQVCTNKSPVVAEPRLLADAAPLVHRARSIDIVAHELGLDPVEVRKRNYVRADEMPYETPNGCVYDSGDYARCLDIALELIGYDSIEERRRDAEARGKLLGVGIGSTLDSGTNNFGQSQLLNPELQFSGNNEVATVKLDIFGEIVVTLGTVPQGQGHETTAAQVVADILGCTPDDVNVRAGPRHATGTRTRASPGTYASQFAVTGLGAVKGATDKLARRDQAARGGRASARRPDDIELAGGLRAAAATTRRRRCRSWRSARSSTRTTPVLPEDLATSRSTAATSTGRRSSCPDKERKFGNLTLTYATQIHACVVEIDPETGVYEIVDYAAVDDCGNRIHPQIVEGQVHGATAQALGAATHETFTYDEEGNLLTPNFYDYHVPHALDMPPLQDRLHRVAVAVHAARREGHGRGRRRRHPRGLRRAPGRAAAGRAGRSSSDSCNPYHRVWELLSDPERAARARRGGDADEGRGRAHVRRRRATTVWEVLNDPAQMAKRCPASRASTSQDDRHWSANVKIPLGLGGLRMIDRLREDRGARARVRELHAKGNGVGAMMNMETEFTSSEAGERHGDALGGRRPDRRPGRRDGPARAAADRQPAGRERARRARQAGARRRPRARRPARAAPRRASAR